jgi:hypothetical protein
VKVPREGSFCLAHALQPTGDDVLRLLPFVGFFPWIMKGIKRKMVVHPEDFAGHSASIEVFPIFN